MRANIESIFSEMRFSTSRLVTCPRPWYRFAPKTSNWRGGTFTRRIAALSAAPKSCHPTIDFKVPIRSYKHILNDPNP
jgi:hypothetical protein